RDRTVTGVQTCALPICARAGAGGREVRLATWLQVLDLRDLVDPPVRVARSRQPGGSDPDPGAYAREDAPAEAAAPSAGGAARPRSEERRVGRERRSAWG